LFVCISFGLSSNALLLLSEYLDESVNVTISEEDIKADLQLRPVYNLDAQLDLLSRNSINNDASEADIFYSALAAFLLAQGVIESEPGTTNYVTDDFMVLVSEDAELRAFSYRGAYNVQDNVEDLPSGCSSFSAGMWVVLFLGVLGMVM
jgi:hypothetical protein